MKFNGLMDMINGGGAGQAGQTFEGGPFSDMLNQLGARPAGFQDRMGQVRPQMRPQQPQGQQYSAPQPQPQPQPMPVGDLASMAQGAINNAPQQAPQAPPQYSGRGQSPGQNLSPDEASVVQYLIDRGAFTTRR